MSESNSEFNTVLMDSDRMSIVINKNGIISIASKGDNKIVFLSKGTNHLVVKVEAA